MMTERMREMIIEIIKECTDINLLDLIYRILIIEKSGREQARPPKDISID